MTYSIALCTYNGAQFLHAQLETLLAQTRLPDELVVCDDCSSDQTLEIVRDFARSAPFSVKIEVNRQNIGSTQNFARAVSLCKGEIIFLCDQDDLWLSTKIERTLAKFEENSALGLAFCNARIAATSGEATQIDLWSLFDFTPPPNFEKSAFKLLLSKNVATGAALAFRANLRSLFLPIPEGPLIHDAWFAALAAAVGPVMALNEPLFLYRRHEGQQVGFKAPPPSTQEHYAGQLLQLQTMRERLGNTPTSEFLRKNLPLLEGRIRHLKARGALPNHKVARLPGVARELFRGGYTRFSNGWRSAAKDLLSP